jgi:hypothetical protein
MDVNDQEEDETSSVGKMEDSKAEDSYGLDSADTEGSTAAEMPRRSWKRSSRRDMEDDSATIDEKLRLAAEASKAETTGLLMQNNTLLMQQMEQAMATQMQQMMQLLTTAQTAAPTTAPTTAPPTSDT